MQYLLELSSLLAQDRKPNAIVVVFEYTVSEQINTVNGCNSANTN